jgi:predicted RNA-binding Zn-ribbon protein involved in translation (DUF1610 family)
MSSGGFREALGKIRHGSLKPVFCPRCGSSEMKQQPTFGILPPKWRCDKCGYEGVIVMELEPEDEAEDREAL